jgi:hypothetical protein
MLRIGKISRRRLVATAAGGLFVTRGLQPIPSHGEEVGHCPAAGAPADDETQALRLRAECLEILWGGSWANVMSADNQIRLRDGHSSQAFTEMKIIRDRQRTAVEAVARDFYGVEDAIKNQGLTPPDTAATYRVLKLRLLDWLKMAKKMDEDFVRALEAEANPPSPAPGPAPSYPPRDLQKKDTP